MEERKVIAEKLKKLFPNGCTRILFVNPPNVPEEDYNVAVAKDNRYPVYPPTGFATLSAALQSRGYARENIDILDLNLLMQMSLKKDPDAFRYDFWKDVLKKKIEEFKPDAVGLTCMFTIYWRQTRRIAEFIKDFNPSLPVLAGGVHTSDTVGLVKESADIDLVYGRAFDMIYLYEGNTSFPDILDFINGNAGDEKLLQVALQDGDNFFSIATRALKTSENMNLIPDYHDLPIGEYAPAHGRIGTYYWLWPEGTRAATVNSNIGCRAHCSFCSVELFNGRGIVFTRDPQNVADELQMLKEKYGISHFMWLDDDLLHGEKRTIALFNEMVRRNLNMTWDASNGIIASAMTEEIAAAMAESGCIGISIGIESGNAERLKAVYKPSGIKHFYRCAEILHKYPQIFVKALLMCGFPPIPERGLYGTISEELDTVNLMRDLNLDWGTIQPLNYIPGVEITNHALEQGKIDKKSLIDGTERPFVGSTGGQIKREKQEEMHAERFENLLLGDSSRISEAHEIKDIWFAMDFLINYERLPNENNPIKLQMLRKLFINICDKTHHTNALGNLYFAVIESKLGNISEAERRLALAEQFAGDSAFWRVRFEALNLFDVADQLKQKLSDSR